MAILITDRANSRLFAYCFGTRTVFFKQYRFPHRNAACIMSRPSGPPPATNLPEPTIRMTNGWHCLHLYYAINQEGLEMLEGDGAESARDDKPASTP